MSYHPTSIQCYEYDRNHLVAILGAICQLYLRLHYVFHVFFAGCNDLLEVIPLSKLIILVFVWFMPCASCALGHNKRSISCQVL